MMGASLGFNGIELVDPKVAELASESQIYVVRLPDMIVQQISHWFVLSFVPGIFRAGAAARIRRRAAPRWALPTPGARAARGAARAGGGRAAPPSRWGRTSSATCRSSP